MSKKGFIYILLNPSLPKYLKIGKTQRTSEERAKEISRQAKTGLPTEFNVAYSIEVSDCDLVESHVHHKLEKNRVNQDREFFNLSLQVAIETISSVITELKKQHYLEFVEKYDERPTLKIWWSELSFVWQQIFRSHIDLPYNPHEIDLLRAVHSIIDNCQGDRLREKVAKLIVKKNFTLTLEKWYQSLTSEKKLFDSYLPYTLSEQELEKVLRLTKINCGHNVAVIDLKPLELLSNLKEIDFTNTSVSDLLSIAKLGKIEKLHFNFTKVDNLVPLENLKNLKEISCYGTNLLKCDIDSFKVRNPHCSIEEDIFLTSPR